MPIAIVKRPGKLLEVPNDYIAIGFSQRRVLFQ
jgi:hypothetical protein